MKNYLAEGILWIIAALTMIVCFILNMNVQHYFSAIWCAVMFVMDAVNSYFGFKRYFRTRKK